MVTGAALAAELEVSTRTLYRDMADLIGQRVPITGETGLGYVLGREYNLPPLMLTPDEIEAVVLGAQWVVEHGDKQLTTAALDVIAKVSTVLPHHLRRLIEVPSVAAKPNLDSKKEQMDTSAFRQAIREGLKINLSYRALSGEETARVVWPVIVGYAEATPILIAWCESRQDFRHFRLDRVSEVQVLSVSIGLRTESLMTLLSTAEDAS
ncbi:helix-turn-helix transcriptional regulator [Pseudomonas sp. NA-150]|uniref:helix-turn-helix transcriptional regulator n=1 Tax=Pseudomonas sp. NA-150 TaxID=3367525 RepID=UPI0037CADB04